MKVFISWSGDTSHKVAVAFRDWLPNVMQSVVPYVSSEDIDKGARWSSDISSELNESFFGILCVTKDNIEAPWLNFEAGALSKSIENSNVAPFLFNLKRSDVSGPIVQFQSTLYEMDDIRKLARTINRACEPTRLDEVRLDTIFDAFWPQLSGALKKIETEAHKESKEHEKAKHREIEQTQRILEEVLELTRHQSRFLAEREKQIYETVRRSLFDARNDMIDAEHPMIKQLERAWDELVTILDIVTIPENQREELNKRVGAALQSLDYIFNKSGIRAAHRSTSGLN